MLRDAPDCIDVDARYIRPLAAREISGLAWLDDRLIVLDSPTGRLSLVDPDTDDTRVLNDGQAATYRGGSGLAVQAGWLWFTTPEGLHRAPLRDLGQAVGAAAALPALGAAELVLAVAGASAVAAADEALYLVVDDQLHELAEVVPGAELADLVRRTVVLHGVGPKGLAATSAHLWVSDRVEQTVYCLRRATLGTQFSVITPLEGPTAIAARCDAGDPLDTVHVAYYEDEPYLKDNPWIDPCWEVRYRDRALVHPLRFLSDGAARMAWSSGHRIQMHYYAEVEPDDDVFADREALGAVEWRMSLPIDSPRQRMVLVEPIGLPFELEHLDDLHGRPQPVAVFRVPRVQPGTRLLIGWRATLEVFGIKHQLVPADLEGAPGLDESMARRYLVDDEDLDLDSPEVGEATAAALGGETNVLLAARRIRAHVYDLLEYEMGNADSPIGVMERGTGSCGEYVGTIMALMRRAGLACRVAGRYKCPYQPWSGAPLHPDFNHVWVDLYLPGHGWVPVESNPDDVTPGGPYPDRFFMGLPWRHVEVGKDISFERVTFDDGGRRRRIGARRLSRNHIRFDVLGEIAPVQARAIGQTVASSTAGAPAASKPSAVSPSTG
jgi:transglutaminase-like putative cysteine protease